MTCLLALGFLSDVWSFVQENADELKEGLVNTLKVSAITNGSLPTPPRP